jgi:hypothetical protein
MMMRRLIYTASCGAAICSLAVTGAPMAVRIQSTQLQAQSIAARVDAAPRGTPVTFSYPTRAGVCGDGNRVIAQRRDGDDYSIMQMDANGSSSSFNVSSRSVKDMMRDCVPGPAHVEVTTGTAGVSSLRVTVGPAAQNDYTAADAVRYLLDVVAVAGQEPKSRVASRALFAASLADAPAELTAGLITMSRRTRLDEDTRKGVIYYMGQSDDARATARLKEILADTDEPIGVRQTAIYALAQQKVPETVPTLLNVARNAREKQLRHDAIFWL